ncbi:MAG: GNAT family N-acetyltransferase [Candidatus Omnitrophota bacterium]|nr:GNAT family N-acetyltransferase [Candidatus Omnitrophota bacterium]
MSKIHRIKQLLQEEGVEFRPPKLLSFFGIFLVFIKLFRRHIFLHKSTIYLLEMPLMYRDLNINMVAQRFTTIEPLLLFAREREIQDTQWHGRSYVSELKERFERGDQCFALESDKKIISVIFVSRKSCPIKAVDYILILPEKTVGLYDVYTVPLYRGQGLYTKLFFLCINACINSGYDRAWIWIMPHNRVSLAVHNKLGMNHVIRSISLCQIFGLKWHIIKALNMSITDL